jgi:hypothetical protein
MEPMKYSAFFSLEDHIGLDVPRDVRIERISKVLANTIELVGDNAVTDFLVQNHVSGRSVAFTSCAQLQQSIFEMYSKEFQYG